MTLQIAENRKFEGPRANVVNNVHALSKIGGISSHFSTPHPSFAHKARDPRRAVQAKPIITRPAR
jgi:hypothetical protein